jgi:hypothetical protein
MSTAEDDRSYHKRRSSPMGPRTTPVLKGGCNGEEVRQIKSAGQEKVKAREKGAHVVH